MYLYQDIDFLFLVHSTSWIGCNSLLDKQLLKISG